ncbi:MAG TPA: uroporphyrinogen decarboxylase family protein [Bacteroidales bacterium]|nr:uroporphyrinogen decarboxylase family protein [Bacteroidales bacterium]
MKTLRDDLISTLRRNGSEKVHVDFVFCPSQVEAFRRKFGHEDYESYLGLSHRKIEIPVKRNFTDGEKHFSREILPESTQFDDYGIGHSKGSELAFHMTRMHHPLKGADEDEIIKYPLPEVDDSLIPEFRKKIKEIHASGLAAFGFMQMTVFEASWYLRSMEELMTDMLTESREGTFLLDKITEFACSKAREYAAAGTDILSLGDDIGTQNSLMIDELTWGKWLQPRLKRVVDTAREVNPDILIFYHSCGYITPFIDKLIDTGIDILNPIQPECMDFDEIHERFGNRLSFWGTLGTQQLLPYGSKDEVKRVALSRLELCGSKGGIVIGPTHMVEPEVPWDNLVAITDAAREFEQKNYSDS